MPSWVFLQLLVNQIRPILHPGAIFKWEGGLGKGDKTIRKNIPIWGPCSLPWEDLQRLLVNKKEYPLLQILTHHQVHPIL